MTVTHTLHCHTFRSEINDLRFVLDLAIFAPLYDIVVVTELLVEQLPLVPDPSLLLWR